MKTRHIIGVPLCVLAILAAIVLRPFDVTLVEGPVSSFSPHPNVHVAVGEVEVTDFRLNLWVAVPVGLLFVTGVVIALVPFKRKTAT